MISKLTIISIIHIIGLFAAKVMATCFISPETIFNVLTK